MNNQKSSRCGHLFLLLLCLAFVNNSLQVTGTTGQVLAETHPCFRTCQENESPRECEYDFVLELYQTLSRACFSCPGNKTDCSRPHCVTADGIERGIFTINKQIPGPSIQVCENDIVVVNVANRIQGHGASMHWHGIHQRGTPYMDGVPMITQCPIPSFTKFQYRFRASNPGTHFYHSHSGLERADGAFGPLVVRQPTTRDPNSQLYDYDLEEHIVTISDWTHVLMMTRYAGAHHSGGDDFPDSILINGRGFYKDSDTGVETDIPVSNFVVEEGKRYRFRLISAASLDCPILLSVDDHDVTVIATDGVPVRPTTVRSVVLFPGERYDVVITANRQVSAYWIRANGLTDCADRECHQAAILSYEGSESETPGGTPVSYAPDYPEGKVLNTVNGNCSDVEKTLCVSKLEAVETMDPSLAGAVDHLFYMGIDMNVVDNVNFYDINHYPTYLVTSDKQIETPQINNLSFIFPSSPPLLQHDDAPPHLRCNQETRSSVCSEESNYCECVHQVDIPLNATVEFVLVDEGAGGDESHPFHIHGYNFHVVGMERLSADSPVNIETVKDMDRKGQLDRNFMNPPKKDTVPVPNKGYTIIRFKADNPGYWYFHCHVIFHSNLGMAFLLHVGEQHHLPAVPNNFPRCGNWSPLEDIHRSTESYANSAASSLRPAFTTF